MNLKSIWKLYIHHRVLGRVDYWRRRASYGVNAADCSIFGIHVPCGLDIFILLFSVLTRIQKIQIILLCHLKLSRFYTWKWNNFVSTVSNVLVCNSIIRIKMNWWRWKKNHISNGPKNKIKRRYKDLKLKKKKIFCSKNALVIFNNLFSWWVCGNCCSCLFALNPRGFIIDNVTLCVAFVLFRVSFHLFSIRNLLNYYLIPIAKRYATNTL